MSVKTIYLHGSLAEDFGPVHRFDVASPSEAVRALCVMIKGFRSSIEEMHVRIFRENADRTLDQSLTDLQIPFGAHEEAMSIHPAVAGAKEDGGLGKLLLGALVIAGSFLIPAGGFLAGTITQASIAQLGLGMALGGLSMILAPSRGSDIDDREKPKSQIINGPVNVATPGASVPVIAGVCEVGSIVVSGAIHIEELATS